MTYLEHKARGVLDVEGVLEEGDLQELEVLGDNLLWSHVGDT